MAGIIPIPTTRVSNMLVRQRLLSQLQGDQLDLFRLQNQVSTGRRITLPSEDAPAAQRAITLQRLIERKTQLRSQRRHGPVVSDGHRRGPERRRGAAGRHPRRRSGRRRHDGHRRRAGRRPPPRSTSAIDQLLAIGNTQFRGRYLFAGSQTNVEPYSVHGNSSSTPATRS